MQTTPNKNLNSSRGDKAMFTINNRRNRYAAIITIAAASAIFSSAAA